MKKTAFQIVAAVSLLFAGCSSLVKADRSKVPDDLYHPATFGDGGDAAATDGGEVDAGAVGDGGGAVDVAGGGDVPSPADAANETGDVGEAVDAVDAGLPDLVGDLPGTG